MTWIQDLHLPIRNQDPLPDALMRRLLRTLKYHERMSSVMAAQTYRRGYGTLALLLPRRGDFTQSVIVGILTAELVERTHCTGRLNGNLLVVTHAVVQQINAIEAFSMDGLKLSEVWNVASFSKYQPINAEKPSIVVSNPGWIASESAPPPRVAVAVVDATHPRTLRVLQNILKTLEDVQLRVVLLPPVEAALRLLGTKAMTWLWDPAAECDVSSHFSNTATVMPMPDLRRLLVCDDDPQFDEALLATRDGLVQMMGQSQPREIGTAWGLYHRMRQLALPLPEYEQAARHNWPGLTLREQLNQISGTEFLKATHRAAWLNALEGLSTAYELLRVRQEPAKFYALVQRLEHLLTQDDRPLTVVAPSRTELPLLRGALLGVSSIAEDAERDGHLEFISTRGEERLIAAGERRRCLLSGSRTSQLTHLDAYASQQPELVLYPHEVPLELAMQKRYYQMLEQWQTQESRRATLVRLNLLSDELLPQAYSSCPKPTCDVINLEGRPVVLAQFIEAGERLDLDSLAQVDTADWFTAQPVLHTDVQVLVKSRDDQVVLHFMDGGSLIVLPERRFPVFSPHGADGNGELRLVKASALRPGQQLVLMVDDVYGSLYDRLTEALGRRKTRVERTLLTLWEEAKKTALNKYGGNRANLYQDLLRGGLSVEYNTMLTWLRETEGFDQADPQKFHDFAALARVSGVYTEEQIHATFQAIAAHRTRQRVAGRHLHALLRSLITHRRSVAKHAADLDSEVAELFAAVQLCVLDRVDSPPKLLRRPL